MDDEAVTLEGQFANFSRFLDKERTGETITLWRSDYWLRQARILDDRRLTMTDTGLVWFKYSKTELTYDEWYDVLTDVCQTKGLDQEEVETALTNCGMAGMYQVNVPQYRAFFDRFKPRSKLLY